MSPHRAALILTTPNHPAAYFVYGSQVLIGVLLFMNVIAIESLSKLLLLPVAGVIMAASGGAAVYAIRVIPKQLHKDPGLRLEQVSAWVVGVINTLFGIALFGFYEWDRAVPTKVYVVGVALTCVLRAVQIRRQRKRLREALQVIAPAAVTALAERHDAEE